MRNAGRKIFTNHGMGLPCGRQLSTLIEREESIATMPVDEDDEKNWDSFHAPPDLFKAPADAEKESLAAICWSLRRAWRVGPEARIRAVFGARRSQWD